MKIVKSFSGILFLIVVLLVLIIVRSTNKNLFKKDAETAVELAKTNLVLAPQIDLLKKPYLIINLGNEMSVSSNSVHEFIHIPFNNLLDKNSREIIEQSEKDILLYSHDSAISSKAWVILNQLNYNNVYIFSEDENHEVLKYKFQPDTLVRPE